MLSVARRIWHRLARGLLWVGILGAVATPQLVPAVRAGAVGTRRHGLDRLNAKLVPAFSYSDRYRPTCRFLPGQDSPSLLLGLVGGVFPDRPRPRNVRLHGLGVGCPHSNESAAAAFMEAVKRGTHWY
jgi:hypothetical protein